MKAFLLADVHLGCHHLEEERWLRIAADYFEHFFLPLLDAHYQPGDVVYLLGDLFDNRSYISLSILPVVYRIFDELARRGIDVVVLVGNHDMLNETSYEATSVLLLRGYANVRLVYEPTVVSHAGQKILLMPWITKKEDELAVLRAHANTVDYLFCHSDLSGAKTNMKTVLTHGLQPEDFVAYPKVYSGHIHIRQTIRNFTFVGSPYHLDRNDKGNRKGIFVLNLETGEETFHENDYSPEFKTLHISTAEDVHKLDQLIEHENTKGDWFDLEVANTLLMSDKTVTKKLTELTKTKSIKLKHVDDLKIKDVATDANLDDLGVSLSIEDYILEYIQGQEIEAGLYDKILFELHDSIKIYKETVD